MLLMGWGFKLYCFQLKRSIWDSDSAFPSVFFSNGDEVFFTGTIYFMADISVGRGQNGSFYHFYRK